MLPSYGTRYLDHAQEIVSPFPNAPPSASRVSVPSELQSAIQGPHSSENSLPLGVPLESSSLQMTGLHDSFHARTTYPVVEPEEDLQVPLGSSFPNFFLLLYVFCSHV